MLLLCFCIGLLCSLCGFVQEGEGSLSYYYDFARMGIQMNQIKPNIVVYCCSNSTAMPEAQTEKLQADVKAQINITRLPCTGRTDVLYMVKAIENGADMAMVVGCPEGQCRFIEGNLRAKMRVRYANRLLAEVGLGNDRIRMYNLDPNDEKAFYTALFETVARASEIGPWL